MVFFSKTISKSLIILRFDNGSWGGLIREIIDEEVDTSVGGFARNLERDEVVDFSPGIFRSMATVFVRKPSKHDLSLRYFTLQFTSESWVLICLGYLIFWMAFASLVYFLIVFRVERVKSKDPFWFALKTSLEVCLRSLIAKVSKELTWKSKS